MGHNGTPPWDAEATLARADGSFVLHRRSLEDCIRRFMDFARSSRRGLLISSSHEIGGRRHGPYILCSAEIERLVPLLPVRNRASAEIIPFPNR
jgi:hypothetical protein